MTTKKLARYEPEAVYIGSGDYVAECVRADDGDYYLAADVDAVIEALRAEVERSERYAEQSERERLWAEERAEQLAEALECMIVGACAVAVPHNGERAVLQDAVNIARAALAAYRKGGKQ